MGVGVHVGVGVGVAEGVSTGHPTTESDQVPLGDTASNSDSDFDGGPEAEEGGVVEVYHIVFPDKTQHPWDTVRDLVLDAELVDVRDPTCVRTALGTYGSGLMPGHEAVAARTLEATDRAAIRRALGYIAGHRLHFEMNPVGRGGGGSKQALVVEDVGAFQLLLQLSVIYPSALRRRQVAFCGGAGTALHYETFRHAPTVTERLLVAQLFVVCGLTRQIHARRCPLACARVCVSS